VLQDKYGMRDAEAACMADFLDSMLALQPEHRCSAEAALQHPWLQPHLSHAEAVAAYSRSVDGAAASATVAAAAPDAAQRTAPAQPPAPPGDGE
jgi:hypothetical protein